MALEVRGISYMADEVSAEIARSDLDVILRRLHCTAVILIGMDIGKLIAAARYALQIGLDVWIEPHPVNVLHKTMLRNLEQTAIAVEELRQEFPDRVHLIVGCEFSVHLNAGLPGGMEGIRMMMIRWRHYFRRRINRKVNKLLAKAVDVARAHFGGPVTYAAAAWEEVDWSLFDYAGINLYRTKGNSPYLTERLRGHVRSAGKPLVITEFGCGAHIGGAQRGPGSFRIVHWLGRHPRLKKGTVRSERVQAAYLCDLIDLWDRNGVHGCFVYTFALREYPHLADPRRDLDMASFGIVKVDPDNPDEWQEKLAFHEVARLYGRMKLNRPRAPHLRRSGEWVR
ncbi:hypothetical protein [Actinocrispum sp. NPDC049592]|uniref:hypothetical protein n=1 Tax=Actinocrispum sp. NPDC049592 TaxID=3154835 RepID=UPI003432DCB9